MMSLTFGLFTQVSGSGPLGPLVLNMELNDMRKIICLRKFEVYVERISVCNPLKIWLGVGGVLHTLPAMLPYQENLRKSEVSVERISVCNSMKIWGSIAYTVCHVSISTL